MKSPAAKIHKKHIKTIKTGPVATMNNAAALITEPAITLREKSVDGPSR